MSRDSHLQPWLLSLLCVALLVVRMGGAHLHLCFDGREPPATLHFTDAGHHESHHGGDAHSDVDVVLVADATGKASKLGLDLPLLIAAFFMLSSLLWATPRPPLRYRLPPAASDSFCLRPPLRGPPRFASL